MREQRTTKRNSFHAVAVGCAVVILSSSAVYSAADYPSRPVTLLVGYSAGGATDTGARIIAQHLGEIWEHQVVVENRPGAGGNIAAEIAATADPDGHTLIMVAPAHAINVSLYGNLPFDALEDFEPVAQVTAITNVLVVHPSVPVNSVEELIDYAKDRPGELNHSSGGSGTSGHMATEYFQYLTGTDFTHIPYAGTGQALPDLLSGEVDLTFDSAPALAPHIASGDLRALGVSSVERSSTFPDVPSISETVSDYEMVVWLGILSPAGTPANVVEKINQDIRSVLDKPEVQERLAGLGMAAAPSSSEDFRSLLETEVEKFRLLVEQSGATVQ